MKERITKNTITTIFGGLIWITVIVLIVFRALGKSEIGILDIALLAFLGYVFFVAKDSLLEGLSLRFFKAETGDRSDQAEDTDVKP